MRFYENSKGLKRLTQIVILKFEGGGYHKDDCGD